VGPRERLAVDRVTGIRARWCGTVPAEPLHGTVQLRAHGDEHRAVVTMVSTGSATGHAAPGTEEVHIDLLDPAYGIAPGQAAVIYDGSRVVGSATIAATRRASAGATGRSR
jgi:tRNA-specific 2-thiouridylase